MKFQIGDHVRITASYPAKKAWGLVGRVVERFGPYQDSTYTLDLLIKDTTPWGDHNPVILEKHLEVFKNGLDVMLELI